MHWWQIVELATAILVGGAFLIIAFADPLSKLVRWWRRR